MTIDQLEATALDLPREERARLAQSLLESLDDDAAEDQDVVEAAWLEEIEHRVAQLESGAAELIPAEQVFAEVRARLKG
jgi:putative addiction module component (TIGR02574 family)